MHFRKAQMEFNVQRNLDESLFLKYFIGRFYAEPSLTSQEKF